MWESHVDFSTPSNKYIIQSLQYLMALHVKCPPTTVKHRYSDPHPRSHPV